MVSFLLQVPKDGRVKRIEELFISFPDPGLIIRDDISELMVWGDPIVGESFSSTFAQTRSTETILSNVYGHYYFVLLNLLTSQFIAGNSYFSILPVYYFESDDKVTLSDNVFSLAAHCGKKTLSRRFVLETVLFNYPLFNHSAVDGICLMPSNSYCAVTEGRFEIIRHTNIDQSFAKEPSDWRESIPETAYLFLKAVQKYLPEGHYFNSFTGGFDGRTLAASGLFHNRNFTAYCFGTESSADMQVAKLATEAAGIKLTKILLDDEYIKKGSLNIGKEFILNSSGTGTFERAHYLHAARLLAGNGDHIITGNFGSELFRAAHMTGEMISRNLFHLFDEDDPGKAADLIEASPEFRILNKETLRNDWEDFRSDLQSLPCYALQFRDLTKNQKFYLFVFEEVFRKYFGAEMINQFRYFKSRTPFLDIDFLRALLKTNLAGIYSDFYEGNPFKRYKGQVLYAEIIHKAFPLLGTIKTDKGYSPDDLLSFAGKLKIAHKYFSKKLRGRPHDPDPNSVLRAWNENRHFWQGFPISPELFSHEYDPANIHDGSMSLQFRIYTMNYISAKL